MVIGKIKSDKKSHLSRLSAANYYSNPMVAGSNI